MYSQHPDLAKRFEAETPKGKKLPEHAHSDVKDRAHAKAEKAGKE